MGKNKNIPNYSRDPEFAPKTLQDHPFYGLELDPEQEIFRDAIWDPEKTIVVCNAKAGTGKSTIAVGTANLLVQYGRYDGIIYIMSPTQEERMGYLPGTLEEKAAPYMQPLVDAMITLGIPEYALMSDDNIKGAKTGDAYIQFMTEIYLRGCNLDNKVIIIDEAANYHFDSLKKTLTRIHDSAKVILIGHTGQCDLFRHPERSGFKPYLDAFQREVDNGGHHANNIAICHLTQNHRGWLSNFCDNVNPPY